MSDLAGYEEIKARHTTGNGQRADDDAAPSVIRCEHAQPHSIERIPPRRWAYGTLLLFGDASVIGAVDGGGKGALATVIALSMTTGKELLGERVWRSGPVAIITYEDDEIEWRRRIAAACLHYKLDYEKLITRFHFIDRPRGRVRLAAPSPNGTVFPDGDAIIVNLKRIGAVLLIIDPFNHAHSLEDGNSNALIAQVAGEAARIARESTVALLALHHLRKGSTGSPDDLMGATSLRATFRATRILQRMTEGQAEKLQLPRNEAWRCSSVAGSKDNYAPPPQRATWYRLESVSLGNPDPLYSDGDNVQVTTLWAPPSPFANIRFDAIEQIFDAIRLGPGDGEHFSPDVRADYWVGQPIAQIAHKSDNEADGIVNAWIENNVLIKGQYRSPKQRKFRTDVVLNEAKAAEILAPFTTHSEAAG
jgi:hypothetical protein